VRCGAAIIRRYWSLPTRPIRWRRHGACSLSAIVQPLWRTICRRRSASTPFENPQPRALQSGGVSRLNIVPCLVGTILTMTMLIFTALSVTRESSAAPWKACCRCRSRRSNHVRQDRALRDLGFVQATLSSASACCVRCSAHSRQPVHAGAALDAVHHHQPAIGYTFSTIGAEPVAGRCSSR